MGEGVLYLVTSFWLGAVHAATPGHGKTIAAAYIVGVRGRPVDALVLGIFVTLSHTSGIVLVAVLATLGSSWLIPQRVEAYLAVATGILVIGIGCWMLRTQMRLLPIAVEEHPDTHSHRPGPHFHSHGWGVAHSHDIDAITQVQPKLAILLGLGIAGGLLPDPGALATGRHTGLKLRCSTHKNGLAIGNIGGFCAKLVRITDAAVLWALRRHPPRSKNRWITSTPPAAP
jgi:nickel/cobalt exporter